MSARGSSLMQCVGSISAENQSFPGLRLVEGVFKEPETTQSVQSAELLPCLPPVLTTNDPTWDRKNKNR